MHPFHHLITLLKKAEGSSSFGKPCRQNAEPEALLKLPTHDDLTRLNRYIDFSNPRPLEEVLGEAEDIFSFRMQTGSKRFFGFIPGPASPTSIAGDMLTSMYNVHAATWEGSAGVSFVESRIVGWLADRAGLPATSGGLFCSGGSIGNLMALAVARDQRLGVDNTQRGVAYLSEAAHISVPKALHLIGLREDQIRIIPTSADDRLQASALQEHIAQDRELGRLPFAIIVTCGTTNTGAIDPLQEVAEIARAEGLWMHVDGAFGASIVLSEQHCSLADGLGQADSITWDAHKWLFQTYGCAMLLMRDKSRLSATFAKEANYLQDVADDGQAPNFRNHGLELTRPARAIKLWITLRTLGSAELGRMIDHGVASAEYMERLLRSHPEWEILSPARLGILVFRFNPPNEHGRDLDAVNLGISGILIGSRIAAIMTTTFKGCTALRACTIHPELSQELIRVIVTSATAAGLQFQTECEPDKVRRSEPLPVSRSKLSWTQLLRATWRRTRLIGLR